MKQDLIIEKQRELIEKYTEDLLQRYFKSSIRELLENFVDDLKALESQEELKPTNEEIRTAGKDYANAKDPSMFGTLAMAYQTGAKAMRDGLIPHK